MQVDSPSNLYHKPNNLFVAGFIGSPQMNFIDAIVVTEGGAVFLEFGEYKIRMTDAKARAIMEGGYEGREVILGVRPEDLDRKSVV
jgi:multiple sugar transport system ATP-binding protein